MTMKIIYNSTVIFQPRPRVATKNKTHQLIMEPVPSIYEPYLRFHVKDFIKETLLKLYYKSQVCIKSFNLHNRAESHCVIYYVKKRVPFVTKYENEN